MLRKMLGGIVTALVLGGIGHTAREATCQVPVTVTGTPDDFSFAPPFPNELGIENLSRTSGGPVKFSYSNGVTHDLAQGQGLPAEVPCGGPTPTVFAIETFHHLAPEVPDPLEAQPPFKGGGRILGYWGVEFATVERGRGSVPYFAQVMADFSMHVISPNGEHHTVVPTSFKPGAHNLPRIDALFPFRDQVRLSPTGKVKDIVGSLLWDPPGLADVFGTITIGGHPHAWVTVGPGEVLVQSQQFSTYSFIQCPLLGAYIPVFRVDWGVQTTVLAGQTIDDSRGFEQYSLLGITPLPGTAFLEEAFENGPGGVPNLPAFKGFRKGYVATADTLDEIGQ